MKRRPQEDSLFAEKKIAAPDLQDLIYCYQAWRRWGNPDEHREEVAEEQGDLEEQLHPHSKPVGEFPLAWLDLETTEGGGEARIVELFAYREPEGDELWLYVNPEKPISYHASIIHRIYDEDVKLSPKFGEVAGEIRAFFQGHVLIAHNGDVFDFRVILREFARAKVPFELFATVDTLRVARKIWPKPHNLQALAERFDLPYNDAHSAKNDVEVLRGIWRQILTDKPKATLLELSRV